jgi:DnaJ-class molecular chaperone
LTGSENPTGACARTIRRDRSRHQAGVGLMRSDSGDDMQKSAGKKKEKCKNCEGKGTLKKGDKIVRCQRCDGTGIKR